MAQEAVTVNMTPPVVEAPTKEKKAETLFGPNIGIVSNGPKWTERREKSNDELTPEVVKSWIAKSKETNHATTTLQALVNLKRPTLRLTPLEIAPSDDPHHVDSQHHHALEFEYDCDAPKCSIRVDVLLSPNHPLAGKVDDSGYSRVTVFETIVDGGFGRLLMLEDGAMLELGRYDSWHSVPISVKESVVDEVPVASDAEGHPDPAAGDELNARHRKRFTTFAFRRRTMDRSVAGPAIAVLDAEGHALSSEKGPEGKHEEDGDDAGVRVTIRLAALDAQAKELPAVNAQVTYLHVVRYGAPPVAVDGQSEEDHRPWVVKVVKREATIGPHTFHLHEIYGLSSNSTSQAPPPAPPPDSNVYPPVANPTPVAREDEPSSECLLCLSSPREVVLLPCRHLVACRECAVNMIEFGAGGTIVHTDEGNAGPTVEHVENIPAAPDADAPAATDETPSPPSSDANAPQPAPPIMNTRRKRKAKGWFCPVCRQPYTSMLRITTTPPFNESKEEHRDSTEMDITSAASPLGPPVAASTGPLRGLTRPGFLRFGRSGVPQTDLERGPTSASAAA